MNLYAVGASTRVVLNRDLASFDFCTSTGRGVNDRIPSGICVEPSDQSTLRDKLNTDFSIEVGRFEELVAIRTRSIDARGVAKRVLTHPPRYDIMTLSSCLDLSKRTTSGL